MKSFLLVLFFSLLLTSCIKEKRYSIVGLWQLAAIYKEDTTGNFSWYELRPGRTFVFNLSKEGEYYFFSDVPEGYGNYNYDYATKKLTLYSAFNGSPQVNDVNHLDANSLIVDIYSSGTLYARDRYRRIKN